MLGSDLPPRDDDGGGGGDGGGVLGSGTVTPNASRNS